MSSFVPVPADVEPSSPPPQQYRKKKQVQGYYYPPPSPEDLAYAAHLCAQQIEFLFTGDNLAQDQYLRSLFDCDGWVPLLWVAQYPVVAVYGADWQGIKNAVERSTFLEFDKTNETVRIRENWQMWVPRGVSHRYAMPSSAPTSPLGVAAGATTTGTAALQGEAVAAGEREGDKAAEAKTQKEGEGVPNMSTESS